MKVKAVLSQNVISAKASFVGSSLSASGDVVNKVVVSEAEVFAGPYEITPSAENQVISTRTKVLTDDIVIKRIPSNYGLIAWNGLGIRVS